MATAARRLPEWMQWLFVSRKTGHFVIVQMPNAPLWLFIGFTAVRLISRPNGTLSIALSVAADLSLAVWAALEIGTGVNPFRRIIGGVVLAGLVISLVTGLH